MGLPLFREQPRAPFSASASVELFSYRRVFSSTSFARRPTERSEPTDRLARRFTRLDQHDGVNHPAIRADLLECFQTELEFVRLDSAIAVPHAPIAEGGGGFRSDFAA